MSTASTGAARERAARDWLANQGWVPIMRAAASKGPADLLMAHPHHGAALIQVGTEKSKSLGPADRVRLCDAADLCGALPLLVTVSRGPTYRVRWVTRDLPSTWAEWPTT